MAPPRNIQHMSLKQAIRYFGPLVNGVASRYGIDGTTLLGKLINGESSGRADAVSNKGARGYTQFMPGTRDSFLKAYGVDAYRSPGEAVYAATLHLRGKLGHGIGLEGYNPGGGQQYVNYILSQPSLVKSDASTRGRTQAPGGFSIPMVGQGGETTTTTQEVPDYEAQKRVEFSNWLLNRDPAKAQRLERLGVLNPNEPTTRTITTSSVSPSASISDMGRTSGGSVGRAASSTQGTANFEGKRVAGWIKPILEYARSHGWQGRVSSGFRTYAEQATIYNSGVRPAARPGTSNHEGADFPRGAIDVENADEARQLWNILRKSPYGKELVYAGAKDPVHFSHPHNGSY